MLKKMTAVFGSMAVMGTAVGAMDHPRESGGNAAGRALYSATGCADCHGHQGQGGAGPALAATRLPAQLFRRMVRAPAGSMPPYDERVLSEAELDQIHDFVQALPGAPPPEKIPALLRR